MAFRELGGSVFPASDIGAKAHNLARLLAWGVATPPTWVLPVHDAEGAQTAPDSVRAAVQQLVSRLSDLFPVNQLWAVRSSGVDEDSHGASFAGVFESYLHKRFDEIEAHVLRCIASASSERAATYSRSQRVTLHGMAVIVQPCLDPDVSGIAFTRDPVNSDEAGILVECALGGCEAVVSGTVTPTAFRIDPSSWPLRIEAGLDAECPPLMTQAAMDAARTAYHIEQLAGFPVDVEWGFLGGAIHVFQFRPITTL